MERARLIAVAGDLGEAIPTGTIREVAAGDQQCMYRMSTLRCLNAPRRERTYFLEGRPSLTLRDDLSRSEFGRPARQDTDVSRPGEGSRGV